MPKVKFLQFFQGKATNEMPYDKGQVAELSDYVADILLRDGIVERVRIPAPLSVKNIPAAELVEELADETPIPHTASPARKVRRSRGKK